MIQIFLIVEVVGFLAAALVHFGVILHGHEHERARIPETIIAVVLLLGFLLTLISPAKLQKIALGVQGFALFGTLIGIVTIIIGIGPQSFPDIAFHTIIIIVLVWGLVIAKRKIV